MPRPLSSRAREAQRFQLTSFKVLCLSGTAACFVMVELVMEILSLSQAGTLMNEHIQWGSALAVLSLVMALTIPCCGWVGAWQHDSCQLCVFGVCSYCNGCGNCLIATTLGVFAYLCASAGFSARSCMQVAESNSVLKSGENTFSSDGCDRTRRDGLMDLCRELDAGVTAVAAKVNETGMVQTFNTTRSFSIAFSEDNCLSSLSIFSSIFLGLVVFLTFARFFATCLQCASGIYGMQLKSMVDAGHLWELSDDSDEDFNSSGSYPD